ncbi:hypothetical protein X975_12969, partial [Stegodyphus mimosarum]
MAFCISSLKTAYHVLNCCHKILLPVLYLTFQHARLRQIQFLMYMFCISKLRLKSSNLKVISISPFYPSPHHGMCQQEVISLSFFFFTGLLCYMTIFVKVTTRAWSWVKIRKIFFSQIFCNFVLIIALCYFNLYTFGSVIFISVFIAKKYVQPADFARILQELSDEEKEDKETFGYKNNSDLREENIEINNISIESEQYISDDDDMVYIGKDKFSKWRKQKYANCSKTKKMNIVKLLPGLKHYAKDIEDEVGYFLKIIDINMLDEILECTNKYISLLKGKYSR